MAQTFLSLEAVEKTDLTMKQKDLWSPIEVDKECRRWNKLHIIYYIQNFF